MGKKKSDDVVDHDVVVDTEPTQEPTPEDNPEALREAEEPARNPDVMPVGQLAPQPTDPIPPSEGHEPEPIEDIGNPEQVGAAVSTDPVSNEVAHEVLQPPAAGLTQGHAVLQKLIGDERKMAVLEAALAQLIGPDWGHRIAVMVRDQVDLED